MPVRPLGGVPPHFRESDPAALWISVALAVLLAAVAFSLMTGI